MRFRLLVVAVVVSLAQGARAAPCDGVEQEGPEGQHATIRRAIAGQLGKADVRVLEVLRHARWSIYLVEPPDAEPAFAFYSGDPSTNHYVTLWGGVATPDEEKEILAWVEKNAPGIPPPLGRCFAWHVTHGRGG